MISRRSFREFCRRMSESAGFSIAELLVASLILGAVSVSLMGMFQSSVRVMGTTRSINAAQACARAVTEQLRSRPFYAPYQGVIRDMDDQFWPSDRGLLNVWDEVTEVDYKGYGVEPYPQFRITVKMVYLQDDTGEATMRPGWGPRTPNSDKPVDSANRELHMIKFQVKVYWKVGEAEVPSSNYSVVTIRTDSEVQANLGVSYCEVTDVGKRGTADNTAQHIYNTVNLRITGFGFKPGCTAFLLMPANNDIQVKGLSYVDEGTLTGYVNLASEGTAGKPWSPRAEPGGWSVKVVVGSAFAVLNEGLVAEFPPPVLTSVNPVQGSDTENNKELTVLGNPIISLSPAGGYNRCSAVMRLVWRNGDDGTEDRQKILYDIPGTAVVTGDSYGSGVDQIKDRFNLTQTPSGQPISTWGPLPQTYYVEVWNVKDYNAVGQRGDVAGSSRTVPFTFEITQNPPAPSQVYQTGNPSRNWGFNNRTYNLTIRGNYFDTISGVTVYLGRGPTPGTPPMVQGTNVSVPDSSTITADFNMTGLAGSEGWLWVYVVNNSSGLSGQAENVYELRRPPRTTSVTNTDGKGFRYNYYDIAVRLDGQDYYSGYKIYYQRNSGGTVYEVGAGDGEPLPTFVSSAQMTGYLNLIGLPVGTYNIWVADPNEYNNIGGSTSFGSAYGPPVLLSAASPYEPCSVWVKFRYRTRVLWLWGWWSDNMVRNDSGTTRAWAPNRYASSGGGGRDVRAEFMVRGMGFLDSTTGSSTNLNMGMSGASWNLQAVIDRAAKTVYLKTSRYDSGVDTSNSYQFVKESARTYNITLTNNNGSGSSSYASRWETRNTSP